MDGLKYIIVEDDINSQEMAADIIGKHFPNLTLAGVAGNLKVGRNLILKEKPNLIILDVNLPDGTAFELLEDITAFSHQFKIIFTTAFSQYAIEAIKFSALDFLLKPYLPEGLVTAFERAIAALEEDSYKQKLEVFYHNFKTIDKTQNKLVLKTVEEVYVVQISEIISAQSDNNYTLFLLQGRKKIMVSQPLKSFEKRLSPHGFLRVHQSHLVNATHIKSYQKKQDHLILLNDVKVPVAQSKKTIVTDYLNQLDI